MKIINKRLLFSFLVILLIPFMLTVRLFYLQVIKYRLYSSVADNQIKGERSLPVSRGEIRDRTNRVLALNLEVDSLAVNPKVVENKRRFSTEVAGILSLDPGEVRRKLEDNNTYFVWIKRKLDPKESLQLKKMDQAGLDFRRETKRYYPLGELACHLIGAVGLDGEGLSGIELAFNKLLIRKKLSETYKRDGLQREINLTTAKSSEYANVILTIDNTLQYIAQKELEKIKEKYRPKRGFIAVQNPQTGEILALACIPSFNPNDTRFDAKELNNPVLNGVFEPGSVFKIVPAAALLEENVYGPDDLIDCENGKYKLAEDVVIDDHEKYKYLSFKGIMAYSSNIGFAKIGMKLGRDKLYNWIRVFGFGNNTGINLPGEQRGIVPSPREKRWTYVTGPIMCYGQGIAVTGIQILNAYSAVANGGLLLEPQVVKALVNSKEESIWHFNPIVIRRALSENTALIIKNMLEEVVVYGTGKKAAVQGYRVAGKTGTAQKIDPATKKYAVDKHIASFCGFLPVENPELTILVVVDEPKDSYWASDVASPAFANVAQEAMNYLSIRKGKKEQYAYIK